MGKRILLVDDEESVAFFLGENLGELGPGYEVETACSGSKALLKMSARPFDLIVTDLRMPGMDGLELIKRARAAHPHTRLILMTAYGDSQVEATAYRLGACRYIAKPFTVEALLSAVQTALAEPRTPGRDILVLSDDRFEAIARCLADLRFEVGAQCILLADVNGQMIASVGETQGLDLPALVSLIGGGFATSLALAQQLGETRALTLNYHEGERYDVYSSNVSTDLFVVLIFEKRNLQSKIGMVWLYVRRTLVQLRALVATAERMNASQVLDADFGAELSDSLDQFLAPGAAARSKAAEPAPSQLAPPAAATTAQPRGQHGAGSCSPSTSQPQRPEVEALPGRLASERAQTFDLDQALELGLLDPSWLLAADDDAEARQARCEDGERD